MGETQAGDTVLISLYCSACIPAGINRSWDQSALLKIRSFSWWELKLVRGLKDQDTLYKGDAPPEGRYHVPCTLGASGAFTSPACKILTFKLNRSRLRGQHHVMLSRKSWKMIQMNWNFPRCTWLSISGYFLLKVVSSLAFLNNSFLVYTRT